MLVLIIDSHFARAATLHPKLQVMPLEIVSPNLSTVSAEQAGELKAASRVHGSWPGRSQAPPSGLAPSPFHPCLRMIGG
jgi:hypothetical protein